jgi:hypothetical protein
VEDKIIIIDDRIICSQEEWDKIQNYKGGLELTKSLMFGHYCESSGEKCDKQCRYCKYEK